MILPLLILLSCNENSVEPNTELLDSGLLGVWQIESYAIDGVVRPNSSCCEFLSFEEDFVKDDLIGLFSAAGPGFITEGYFEADFKGKQITFNFNMHERVSSVLLSEDQLVISYTENDLNIEEVWNRNN